MSLSKKNTPQLIGLAFSLVIILLVSKVSYDLEMERIKTKVIENLHLNHELSIASISGNLKALQEEIQLLAESTPIKNFVNNASSNTNAIANLDEWGKKIVAHFGYHDVLIINKKGDVIYSVVKEKDLGTNLVNGPFANSGLGKVNKRIQETKEFSVADFSVYEPSNNMLAGFVGAPIFEEGKYIGFISIQLPTSFEKLNIGVHIEGIEDYIITTNYYFDRDLKFQSVDDIGFTISKERTAIMKDSLFLFTPFKLGNLSWGILSVAPPVVFKSEIRWSQIWYNSTLALLGTRILVLIVLFQYKKRRRSLVYIENEAVIVQNTWYQFAKKGHSFGIDFYYRIKNKNNIDFDTEKEDIAAVGALIEEYITEIIDVLLNEVELKRRLQEIAKVFGKHKISNAQILRMPDLFLESFEDEMGKEIPIRAKLAWQKILKSISYRLVGILKKDSNLN